MNRFMSRILGIFRAVNTQNFASTIQTIIDFVAPGWRRSPVRKADV
jgi:hypothetical protein